jgi:Outer membrane protein beta-barrel domain
MEFVLKKILIGLASVLALSAQAQSTTPAPASSSGLRGIVGLGLTGGGETIARVQWTNGDSTKLSSGGLIDFRGGAEYQIQGQPVAIELSIGYHFDKANGSNGSVGFTRFPLELIGHYALDEYWRLGLGLRKSLSTEYKDTVNGDTQKFTSSISPLVEAEYFMTPQFSFKGRYVVENFKTDDAYKAKLKGSHAGIYGMFYF